ncbi:response regulator transcription factor [Nocardioides sp. SYSU D00038]|uniref:LuxR C-terminal-related transcriptional regulator n=1 Tax=Nocardioides sp. SYSU D00038 TaxID=2812554 RepID=UPI001968A4A0|nr:response regulator transcription factor [Nocardioides sp. SYSU D00038]
MPSTPPITVAIVNDYELVVAGVASLLEPFSDRVAVVELDSGLPVVSDVDVILYDTFGQVQGDGVDLDGLVRDGHAKVIVFSWNLHPELVENTLARGARGYLSKAMSAEEIVVGIEEVHRGGTVAPVGDSSLGTERGEWPGRDVGLSAREAEVVALITQGLSNREIAERTYLSINSVKTYIRTAYRKMGVERRAQAVLWGIAHGFEPDRLRVVDNRR